MTDAAQDAGGRGVVTRFAPSPTGRLHVGNMRTALFNWLFARKHGGSFVLRLDDTDRERSTEGFAQGIREDLAWLGLAGDREERQSARHGRYEAARAALAAAGRLYPCYETEEELEVRRRLAQASGRPPVYDRSALSLDAAERRRLEDEGRRPHWRFRLSDRPVVFRDLIRGDERFEPGHVSDPVLVREDGQPTYTLASVVDDIDFGVSHVIRGEDHVSNTAVQIELIEALGATPPAYAHHPLITDGDGRPLSKSGDSPAVATLRDDGIEAMALVSWLARTGTSESVAPAYAMAELIAAFDLGRVSRSPQRFERDAIAEMSRRWLHGAPWEAVAESLDVLGVGEGGEAFWTAVRGNLDRLVDVRDWWAVCKGPVRPVIEDPDLLARALRLLPAEPWGAGTWKVWTGALQQETGRKGRSLFHPLRLALTGREKGPDLGSLLPLIGREAVVARLECDLP